MSSMLVGNTASCRACLPCNDLTYPSSKLVCFAEYSRDLLDEPDCKLQPKNPIGRQQLEEVVCDQDRCSGPDTAIRSHSRSESESSDLFPVALLSAALLPYCNVWHLFAARIRGAVASARLHHSTSPSHPSSCTARTHRHADNHPALLSRVQQTDDTSTDSFLPPSTACRCWVTPRRPSLAGAARHSPR